MDNSPLWLNTVSGPSGEKGANSANRVYLTDRPGFGVQPGGNSQWKPQLIIIFTRCKIFPCQIIRKKKGSLLEHHTFSRILRGGGGNKTQPDSKEMNIQMHSSFFFFFSLCIFTRKYPQRIIICVKNWWSCQAKQTGFSFDGHTTMCIYHPLCLLGA